MAAPAAPIEAAPSVVEAEIAPAEVRAQLSRILESDEFRAARNRARFLEYVVDRTLEGSWETLKEYTIGVEVFDRGSDFDPRADGVVRTQAGLVRKHLELYYEAQGARDPVEIALPKGRYVPRFLRRSAESPAAGPTADASAPPLRARTLVALLLAAAAVLLAGAAALVMSTRAPGARTKIADQALYRPVWGPFFDPGATNMLAFGIPQFFTSAKGIWVRDVEVNAPANEPDSPHLRTMAREWGPLRPAEAYTGIGEAYGVHVLTQFFVKNGHDLRVVRSPSVSWEDLKHDNVIFLTSARFKTLAGQLSYPAEFRHAFGATNRVQNVHPAPGEQDEYVVQTNGSERPDAILVDHAIISVWPGKTPGRRILVLSGAYTWGTQAAAEFVTEPAFLKSLNEKLLACQRQHGLAQHSEFFQVVVRVEGRDTQPTGVTYVTHHDFVRDEPTGDLVAFRERPPKAP